MAILAPLSQLSTEEHIVIHQFFETLALMIGGILYQRNRLKKANSHSSFSQLFPILGAGLLGAGLGSHGAFWIHRPDIFAQYVNSLADFIKGGQSVIGGLIGGLIGIELAKKITGYPLSTGDYFVTPILVGLIIGRIGCFLTGLQDETYGIATNLPWAVDFGDGIARHPTQIYDMIFALVALVFWKKFGERLHQFSNGLGFKITLCAYILWRFYIEFLKPAPYVYKNSDLTGLQLICLIFCCIYVPLTVKQILQSLKKKEA